MLPTRFPDEPFYFCAKLLTFLVTSKYFREFLSFRMIAAKFLIIISANFLLKFLRLPFSVLSVSLRALCVPRISLCSLCFYNITAVLLVIVRSDDADHPIFFAMVVKSPISDFGISSL